MSFEMHTSNWVTMAIPFERNTSEFLSSAHGSRVKVQRILVLFQEANGIISEGSRSLRDIPGISQKLLRGSSPKGVGNRQKPTRESEVGRAPLASFQVTFYWNLPVVLILPSPRTWLLYHPTRVLGGFRSISRASSSTEARKRKHACRRKPCYAFFPK